MTTKSQALIHSVYGKIYTPIYNINYPIKSGEPELYNKNGHKLKSFFIRDLHLAHNPYHVSKYFIWDRYNIELDTHFYTHNAMLETMGSPSKKYGWLLESESIVPEDYKIFDKNKGLNKEFDAIFTYDEKIVKQCNEKDYEQRLPC